MLGAMWILNELLRATVFTGFAWNPIAAIWAPVEPMRMLTRWIGTYGLSGLTVLLGALTWEAVTSRAARIALIGSILAATMLAFLLPPSPPTRADAPLLHVVQPNIGQDRKWDATQSAGNYHRLTSLSGKAGPRPRILLWPEVAVPALLEQDPLAREALSGLLGPRDLMLTGAEAIRFDANGEAVAAANSVFALDPRGRLLGRYDKAHLVPYGEYLPMRPLLSRIGLSRLAPGDMDFDAGPGPRDIVLPGIGPIGIQICYEIIFSGQVVDRAHRPIFLFNPSNDAWFGRWGPPQHLAQARLRATEEGLPVVRSTPTGISAVIDANGRLLAALHWRTAGFIETPLPPAHAPTPFARWGNILPLVLALFFGAIGFACRRRAS
jgi:apolipoprotein N-acyltransferase